MPIDGVAMSAIVTSSLVVDHWHVSLVFLVAIAGAVVDVDLARSDVIVQVAASVVHQ